MDSWRDWIENGINEDQRGSNSTRPDNLANHLSDAGLKLKSVHTFNQMKSVSEGLKGVVDSLVSLVLQVALWEHSSWELCTLFSSEHVKDLLSVSRSTPAKVPFNEHSRTALKKVRAFMLS